MNALEMLKALGGRGIYVSMHGEDSIRLEGETKKLNDELRSAIKDGKKQIIEHYKKYPKINAAPDKLPYSPFKVSESRRDELTAMILFQKPHVIRCVIEQATRYRGKNRSWSDAECELTAMLDVIKWQGGKD